MRLHSYRDESHSRLFDLIGGGGHPWSIDLVSIIASGILVVGFACALIGHWVHYGPLSMGQQASVGGPREPKARSSGHLSMEHAPSVGRVRAVKPPSFTARFLRLIE